MLLVTGCGRSGTSAVARLLHESGMSVGDDLIPADAGNEEGYYEERRLNEINDAIMVEAGLQRWFATASRELLLSIARRLHAEMRELVARATPAWKDPRLCWTLEAWLEVLPQRPRVIVCVRNPAEVAASTMTYFGLAGDEASRAAQHVWRVENERLLEVIEDYRLDVLVVEYDAVITDPETAVAPIARFAGLSPDPRLIRRDLRHHRAPMPPELEQVYGRVVALGRG